MKKYNVIFLVLIVTFLVSACTLKTPNLILSPYTELDKLPQEYSPELASKNGDVVSVEGKGYNIEKFDAFIEKFKNKKANDGEMIRVTTYTVEGDPIISDLIISGESIKLVQDNTRDKFGSPQKREHKVVDIIKQKNNGYTTYIAKTDMGKEIPLIDIRNK